MHHIRAQDEDQQLECAGVKGCVVLEGLLLQVADDLQDAQACRRGRAGRSVTVTVTVRQVQLQGNGVAKMLEGRQPLQFSKL